MPTRGSGIGDGPGATRHSAGGDSSGAPRATEQVGRGGPKPHEREREIESSLEGSVSAPGARGGPGRQAVAAQGGGPERARSGGAPSAWLAGADNPLAMVRRMQDDMERIFRAFGIPRFTTALAPARELEELLASAPGLTQAAQWSPQIEVLERDNALVVRADLPGVKRDDVEVNVENDVLTIRGHRRHEQRDSDGGYRRTERSYGSFFRQIPLPDGVEPDQIEASYENGVLEVTIPSPREPRGRRRIDIR